jgi:hypothetical protein
MQYVMPSTGDGTFRVMVAFAVSEAWEHSHCRPHMHEHIFLCPG